MAIPNGYRTSLKAVARPSKEWEHTSGQNIQISNGLTNELSMLEQL